MSKFSAAVICLLIASNIYLIFKAQNYKHSQDDFSGSIYISSNLVTNVNRSEMPEIDQRYYNAYKDSKTRFPFVSMDEAREMGYDDKIFNVLFDAYAASTNVFELLYLFGIYNKSPCSLIFEAYRPGQKFSFRRIVVEGIKEPYFEGSPGPPVLMIIYDVYTGEILNMGFYSAFF